MAGYGITNYFKGGTKEQCDATVKAVLPGPPTETDFVIHNELKA